MVPQHYNHQDDGQSSWWVQQRGPPWHGVPVLRIWKEGFSSFSLFFHPPHELKHIFTRVIAIVGPQHRLAPIAPKYGLSAIAAQFAMDLQLIQGAGGGEVDAEASGPDEGILQVRYAGDDTV